MSDSSIEQPVQQAQAPVLKPVYVPPGFTIAHPISPVGRPAKQRFKLNWTVIAIVGVDLAVWALLIGAWEAFH
jgi:hypothetical protein